MLILYIHNTYRQCQSHARRRRDDNENKNNHRCDARTNKFKNSIVLSHSFMFSGQGFSHHGSLLSILARVRVMCGARVCAWRADPKRAPPWGVRRARASPTVVVVVVVAIVVLRGAMV